MALNYLQFPVCVNNDRSHSYYNIHNYFESSVAWESRQSGQHAKTFHWKKLQVITHSLYEIFYLISCIRCTKITNFLKFFHQYFLMFLLFKKACIRRKLNKQFWLMNSANISRPIMKKRCERVFAVAVMKCAGCHDGVGGGFSLFRCY